MNISTVSASCCELTFAVDFKNRLLESLLPFTSSLHPLFAHKTLHPPPHTNTHTHINTVHTNILLQAVQSGVRHVFEKKENT